MKKWKRLLGLALCLCAAVCVMSVSASAAGTVIPAVYWEQQTRSTEYGNPISTHGFQVTEWNTTKYDYTGTWYRCEDLNKANPTPVGELVLENSVPKLYYIPNDLEAGVYYYYLEVTAKNKGTNTIAETNWSPVNTVTVKPSVPKVDKDWPTVGPLQCGQTLSESAITGGTMVNKYTNAKVEGTFAWKDGSRVLTTKDTGRFDIVFSPSDTKNYMPGSIRMSVRVAHVTDKEGTITTAPTCTNQGWRSFTCSGCGTTYSSRPIPALDHDYTVQQSDGDNHWKKCSRCDATDTPKAHQWDEGEVTTPATCTATGEKTYTCTVCNRTKTETLAALEHNYGEPSYVWNGTSCTAERVCSRDGSHKETETATAAVTVTQNKDCVSDELSTYTASFQNTAFAEQTKENVVTANKLGHDFENGTWQSDGDGHWKKCSRCDVTDEASKAPHNWDTGVIKKQPTCTTAGEKTFTCTVCNRTKTETLAALEHNYGEPSYVWNGTSCTAERVCSRDGSHKETETATAAVTVTQNKDCVSDELSTYTASFQNTAFAEQTKENVVTANKLGHDFENGTWQSDGDGHWKKCSRCDVTDEASKAPHNWDTGVIKKQPTCTTAGEKTFTCTVCNRTKTETVSATGHSWSSEWTSDTTHHWHECENANCDVTENSGKSGYAKHSGGTANCTQQAVCTICGTAYGDLDANGHDWGEWRVTTPATTSAAGVETRVCKRDASHTETRDIPKLTPAPSGGGSSSGSSGGSSSTPAVTVPVSGSGDTVHVSASVSGSTAEVKEIKSAELDKIGTDSAVVIDLSGLNKGVTSVTLSTDTIDSICKTEADGVTVKLPSAELRVDRQTLAAVTEQAAGSKIRLVVEPDGKARGTMTAAQRSTLAGMKNAAALEAYFVSNNTRIHDFKGGSVELSIPYRAEGAIRAWFLREDGTREPVSARYDKENAQLILHHFSHYVIEELDSSAAYTVCAKDDSCPLGAFGDLTATAWYHDGVHYCLENGLMRGVSGGKFLPDGSTTRAQLVTILWRLEGSPETTGAVRFGDTAGGAWYTEAVRWAVGCGVVKGYDNECFGPDDAVTREQMAAILYRYAQHKGYDVSAGEDTNILSFDDAFAVSEYAIPAMQWACGSGMVHGIARDGRMLLAPRDTTTRAQTATLLMRFQSAFAKEP